MQKLHRRSQIAEDRRPRAREDGRDEQEQLVDEAGLEERGRESRAAFEQERLDALHRERAQLLLEQAAAQLELGSLRQRPPPEGEPPRLTRGTGVAGVEPRRVGPHRPHPDRDCVRSGSQLVYPAPRLLARYPPATGNGDPLVERDRSLVGDEWPVEGLPDAPGLV